MRLMKCWAALLCTAAAALGFAQTAAAQSGACCTTAGVCTSVASAAACAATSQFLGVGTSCTPNNSCAGACCNNTTLVCTTGNLGTCTGTFLGLGTVCSPTTICNPRAGACCTSTGGCTVVLPAACTGTSLFQGAGTTCTGSPCAAFDVAGTCCTPNGTCTITGPAGCVGQGLVYNAAGTTCTSTTCTATITGACCTNQGACSVSGRAVCLATTGNAYRGDGTTCPTTTCADILGACCTAGATPACNIRTAAGCTGTSLFLGVGSTCPTANPCTAQVGACCDYQNTCTVTISTGCTGASNAFLGIGTACSPLGANSPTCNPLVINGVTTNRPVGACCAANGTCTLAAVSGQPSPCFLFLGAGTTCTPNACAPLLGACCNAFGGCTIAIAAGCSGANSFRGAGTVCTPAPGACGVTTGSCCNSALGCFVSTAGGCTTPNSFIAGGTCAAGACNAIAGACCDSLASCTVTTAAACASPSVFRGTGTTCATVSCTASFGACCNTTFGTCALTSSLGCPTSGDNPQTWTAGLACAPSNPCVQPTGACCIGTGCSANIDGSLCLAVGGAFFQNQSCAPFPCVRPPVVISQFYTGGGTTNAVLKYDYVELHNTSNAPVVMTNWALHFGAQSTQTFPTRVVFSGTIPANGFFLIQLASTDVTIGADLPVAADLIPVNNLNLDLQAGRLALTSNANALPNGCPSPFPVTTIDFVGYGNQTGSNVPTCSEGATPTGYLGSGAYAFYRKGNGCQDTDVNGVDFMLPQPPSPRNTSTAIPCVTTGGGACCDTGVCTIVADPSGCSTFGFQGRGSTCVPVPPATDICAQPTGSCCNGPTCTQTSQLGCTAGIFNFGRPCGPVDQCSGACCTGTACVVSTRDACTGTGYFQAGLLCTPANPCPGPVVVQSGDIAYGASVSQYQDSVQQIRGTLTDPPSRVGTWTRYNNLQSTRFDNRAGILHNARGNLLALDFGNPSDGGAIYNLPTNGDSAAGSPVFNFATPASSFGLQRSRLGGLSVSPNNDRLACIGYDYARLYVLSYAPGATPGTGSGATTTGGASTDSNSFIFGFNLTQGTGWIDNDTVVMWVLSDVASVLKLYTVPVSGTGASIALGTPVERLAVSDGKPNSSRFTSLAYNPQLIPGYIFLGASAFQGSSFSTIYVVNITNPSNWVLEKTIDVSASSQTFRELAIGPDRNLYFCQFAGSGQQFFDPLLDRLVLDADGNGVVTAAEIAAIGDNSSTDFYLKGQANSNAFNGFDIAVALGACCRNGVCSIQPPNFCVPAVGVYGGDGSTCGPTSCMAVCCRGATCSQMIGDPCTAPGGGSRAGAVSGGAFPVCNIGASRVPCCKADYNKTSNVELLDIFDFLGDWFNGYPYANHNGDANAASDILDIFSFLADWFAGPC